MTEQLNQMLDWLWRELVEFYPIAMAWMRHKPQNAHDYVEIAGLALIFGAVMAGIGFLQLGTNPTKAMYERSHAVADGKFFSPLWKLLLFVFGEDFFYRGLGMSYAVHIFQGDEVSVLVSAALISVACGFLPPHRYLPMQTQVAIMPGVFFLSLLYLKCGGWETAWPFIDAGALLITTAVHLVPVLVLTTAFEVARRKHTPNNTPRPP